VVPSAPRATDRPGILRPRPGPRWTTGPRKSTAPRYTTAARWTAGRGED